MHGAVSLAVAGLAAAAVLFAGSPVRGAVQRPPAATFEARSYRVGGVAQLRIDAGPTHASLQLFLVGGHEAPGAADVPWDRPTSGKAMTTQRSLSRNDGSRPWRLRIGLPSNWPSGVYVARLRMAGVTRYAPFVLRPHRLGAARVLVVEPTNTWQAYNFEDRDSWYLDSGVHAIDLARPYPRSGLPSQFVGFGLGFLRWYWRSGFRADFLSDDDLEHCPDARRLHHYRLIVFASHEEYVTSHVYGLIESYRNLGGNLAFLSADNFFYRVTVSGDTMVGRTRWRDLGRPEASLAGAEYVGWDEARFPNRPYRVVDMAAAPWLFTGSHLRHGSRFGSYGIEIDQRTSASPADTRPIAAIRGEFGSGKTAQMTVYRRGRATVFDAGVMNFGASADWPGISTLVQNLWTHLSGEQAASDQLGRSEQRSERIHPLPLESDLDRARDLLAGREPLCCAGHDLTRIPDELLDRAAVPLDDPRHPLEIPARSEEHRAKPRTLTVLLPAIRADPHETRLEVNACAPSEQVRSDRRTTSRLAAPLSF